MKGSERALGGINRVDGYTFRPWVLEVFAELTPFATSSLGLWLAGAAPTEPETLKRSLEGYKMFIHLQTH